MAILRTVLSLNSMHRSLWVVHRLHFLPKDTESVRFADQSSGIAYREPGVDPRP